MSGSSGIETDAGIVRAAEEGAAGAPSPLAPIVPLDDTHVHAVMRASLWRRATTKPVPASGCAIAVRGQASATLTVET
jgi:hypothetical protein